jgi:hypothetical protein
MLGPKYRLKALAGVDTVLQGDYDCFRADHGTGPFTRGLDVPKLYTEQHKVDRADHGGIVGGLDRAYECLASIPFDAQAIGTHGGEVRTTRKEDDILTSDRKRCAQRGSNAAGSHNCDAHYTPLSVDCCVTLDGYQPGCHGRLNAGQRRTVADHHSTTDQRLRGAVRIVALLNLGYFGVEFAVAFAIGSVSLFADSIDFLEDASVNLLIAVALRWAPRPRARLGMMLAGILFVPSAATIWTAWTKFNAPTVPAPLPLAATGLGALAVNLSCALILASYRHHRGSLTRAAFLSARNDALANLAIIAAGAVTALLWHSAWPDLIVGLAIVALNADAARQVWTAAREEHAAVP